MIKEKTTKGGGAGRAKKWNPTHKKKKPVAHLDSPQKAHLATFMKLAMPHLKGWKH